MAFHQPTRQQVSQRVFCPSVEEEEAPHAPQTDPQAIEESQTWVLFSPATDAGTTTSYLTETHNSKSTLGRSRLSDLGSLNTIARSEQPQSASIVDEEDEDAELDSLDSHLPEFRSNPNVFNPSQLLPHATPVVPAHDGLGSFRLDQEGMGADVQDRLYAFEQYNPHRVKRRRESLDLAHNVLENEQEQEMDKMRRIESWRLEHSRYLLEEIRKEATRRKTSITSVLSTRLADQKAEERATLGALSGVDVDIADQGEAWHDQQASDLEGDDESIWSRITRKVIRDLMGIDDKLLSVLFGESLPDEDDLSTTPKASTLVQERGEIAVESSTNSTWQLHILERVAKELGLFVNQLSEHPGAFSTFSRAQQTAIPYAGLPPIIESAYDVPQNLAPQEVPATIPEFEPTVMPQSRPIAVPSVRTIPGSTHQTTGEQGSNATAFTQDEWEKDLDVRLVFKYLRSRFMSRSNSSGAIAGNPYLATASTQDAAAKAARVRQHHPLMRARPSDRRAFKAVAPSSPVLFRPASSCASQSTRISVRKSSCSSRHSSRHYWDIGAGSVGTGSLIAAAGPMGSWGEV
ncbi:uncharacterized protein BCR38DRAFT_342001 [Pseudomassariella vexata]|uniref:Uncharacterized protein n=1 Tax=Pseudomassariella vexata TaxID=1141098 RepID=A0A1Y2E1I5_9PEZI|nr:uncharacterized protein BCR38DRAFT_342001 [Pseudomassariella vexata]ORY65411.1 hypothetical protein BCR38DRAFT_342001 [Pseudomassariella vexata]